MGHGGEAVRDDVRGAVKHLEKHVRFLQDECTKGMRPSAVLTKLLDSIEVKYEGHRRTVEVVYCLVHALKMPLSEAVSLGGWSGFGDGYTFSDADVDNLLLPWFDRYRENNSLETARETNDGSNSS